MRRLGRPITHRQIPLQIGYDFPTYENKMIQHGEIEDQFSNILTYDFNRDFTLPQWSMLQDHNL